jgi:hypothetical protein
MTEQPAAIAILGNWAGVAGEFYDAFLHDCMLVQDSGNAQHCLSFAIDLELQRTE